MQILITAGPSSPTRVYQFTPLSLMLAAVTLIVPLMGLSVALYHAVVLKAAQEQWPIISDAVRFVERQEQAQRDHFVRENLDAMAVKVGDLQARLMRLEAVGERVAGMAGMKADELKKVEPTPPGAAGSGASDPAR